MAATPESRVKARVKAILSEYGAWYFMPVSNGMGRHGIPDILACLNGRFIAVECKAGKGKTTALQDRELAHIEAAGGVALVVTDDPATQDELRRNLEMIRREEE